jgi:nitrate reductase gamma subunit
METLIDFGRGPFFRFALAIALLGLARHIALSTWGLIQARRRAGDKRLDWGALVTRTVSSLNPLRYMGGSRGVYTVLSVAFHVGLILVPIFYIGHIQLWERGLGLAWPALPTGLMDTLTLVTVVAGLLLVIGRAVNDTSRQMSRFQDWALPPLISVAFLTGYLLAHPATNPLSLATTEVLHIWTANLLLVLTPFTKIAHCILLPFSQLVAEMAWRLVPGAGQEIAKTLGKEGQPI